MKSFFYNFSKARSSVTVAARLCANIFRQIYFTKQAAVPKRTRLCIYMYVCVAAFNLIMLVKLLPLIGLTLIDKLTDFRGVRGIKKNLTQIALKSDSGGGRKNIQKKKIFF